MKIKDGGLSGVVALVMLILVSGCSTGKSVPDVDPGDLYAPSFKAISPRNIHLIVTDERQVNRDAGNTTQVEQAIYKSVAAALEHGGLRIKDNSKNRLNLVIQDYDGPNAMGECVKIEGTLHAKWNASLIEEAMGCHQLKNLIGISYGGSVSQAYVFALNFILKKFDDDQMQLLRF